MTTKPKVLLLGGTGFIGRNLLEQLVCNDLVSYVRVVDKTPPEMAYLNKKHVNVYDSAVIVEFRSANLINKASCDEAFKLSDPQWDFVINCAAETRPNQSDAVYKQGIADLSYNCASASARLNVKRYIELSSANMKSSENVSITEECSTEKPWTNVAKYKAIAEKELTKIPNLNYTIVRLPLVYGMGDRKGLTPRILIAALYKHLNEPMKLLWNESMKMNTVHVRDVCAAIWTLLNNAEAKQQVFNICDDAKSTQGSVSAMLARVFSIKVEYWGVIMSNITKLKMTEVIEEINDKHIGPWAKICQLDNIENTPLTPYMDAEQLYHCHLNVDNSKLKQIGFKLQYPNVTQELIEEIINDFIERDMFPKSLKF